MGQEIPEHNSDETLASASTNPTPSQDDGSLPLRDDRQSSMPEPVMGGRDVQSPKRSSTGPRSKAGRRRSSRNAIRHGIFSEVTLLPGEPIFQYRSIQMRFRDPLHPEDEVEEVLVEKLVSLAWRCRRFLSAEGAEIRRAREFLESDQRIEHTREAGAILTETAISSNSSDFQRGMIAEIQNPDILDQCLKLLLEIRLQIQAGDLDRDRSVQILEKVYGSNAYLSNPLFESYRGYCDSVDAEPSNDESWALVEKWRKYFLFEVSEGIRGLRAYRRERTSVESAKLKLDVLRHNVPEPDHVDQLRCKF